MQPLLLRNRPQKRSKSRVCSSAPLRRDLSFELLSDHHESKGPAVLASASRNATLSSRSLITRSLSWITMREFCSCRTASRSRRVRPSSTHTPVKGNKFCMCALTCSIMCRTFLCWHFSMSSKWWIFSLRTVSSFSNCLALRVQTQLLHYYLSSNLVLFQILLIILLLPIFSVYFVNYPAPTVCTLFDHPTWQRYLIPASICRVLPVHRPFLSTLAVLPRRAQAEQLLLMAADVLPQARALRLHPSQQPLQLLDALTAPLAGVFGTPQLLPLFIQLRPQSAAFSLQGEKAGLSASWLTQYPSHQQTLVRRPV